MSDPSNFTIDAPVIAPATGGILASPAVNVIPASGYELYYGVQYVPVLQGQNRPVPDEGTDKVFDKIEGLNKSKPFAVYRGVDVSLMRFHGEAGKLAKAAFEAGESHGIEVGIQEKVFNPVAVDIHPAGKVTDRRLAVGLLQQYARDNFSGEAIITGNALALELLGDSLSGTDAKLTTKLGTSVVLTGGYGSTGPGSAVAGPDEAWLYISGPVNLWRGTVQVEETQDLKDNREIGLAEALYASTVDGPVGALLIGI